MNMNITTSPGRFSLRRLKITFWSLCYAILMLIGGTTNSYAIHSAELPIQQTIGGMVTDQNGVPLPAVNVFLKGTTVGTQTDFDGNYALEGSEGQTLVFSYVGYETQEIVIGDQDVIDVSLQEDASQLDEIVVMGYTAQTRGDVTGSVSSVDISEATKAPIVNAAEALQGRVTGVTVMNDGAPGSSPVVRIRGFGTSNNNNPLYIIDGVQTDDPSI